MTYIRAEKAQIDAWEEVGNHGWNWNDLYRYYKKSEQFDRGTSNQLEVDGVSFISQYHGFDGPLHVGYQVELNNGSFHETVNETVQGLGVPFNPDVNGGRVRGFTLWQSTFDRFRNIRSDSARAYFLPVRGRSNLHVFESTLATKMVWNSSEPPAVASGVEVVLYNNQSSTIIVRKEIIVSAGSLRSPAFLELSGVGNPKYNLNASYDSVTDCDTESLESTEYQSRLRWMPLVKTFKTRRMLCSPPLEISILLERGLM